MYKYLAYYIIIEKVNILFVKESNIILQQFPAYLIREHKNIRSNIHRKFRK